MTKPQEHIASEAIAAGQEYAQLFLGFSCFLHEACRDHGIQDLFFCTREGVFFKGVFDALFNRAPKGGSVRTHLLEASRLSVFSAAALRENELDLSGLFRLYKQQSPATILRSLGLEVSDYSDLLERHDLDPDQLDSESVVMSRFEALLADGQFRSRAWPVLQSRKESALGYFSWRFKDIMRIGFVDIGWRGTIQNSMAGLMPERQFIGLYMGLALERNIMNPNCQKFAYGPNQNLSRENIDLLHAVNVLEFLCLSTQGSTSGYVALEDGTYRADMHVDLEENRGIESFPVPFQQGVVNVALDADPQELLATCRKGALRGKALKLWRQLIRRPPQGLVDAYFSSRSNEVFGLGTISNQSRVPSLADILSAIFMAEKRKRLVRFLTYNQWAEGVSRRRDLKPFSAAICFLLLKIARALKIFIQQTK